MERPRDINVAITGAAGNIGYALLPKLLDGLFLPDLYGQDYKVNLSLLEIPQAMQRLEGTALELEDFASPHLGDICLTDEASVAFNGANLVFLLGGIPRKEGMTRADLLQANAPLFIEQGKALNDNAADDVRVVVVSNPANSIALTALSNAPDIPARRFNAMTRLDHNRAVAQLALRADMNPADIEKLVIWGNHSDTMVVDIFNTESAGLDFTEWHPDGLFRGDDSYEKYLETVANRGSAIIKARGGSSAVSAAAAAVDTARDWLNGSNGRWHSMGLMSQGEYGIPEGIVYSYPVTTETGGEVEIVPDVFVSQATQKLMQASADELLREKQALIECGALIA